MQAGRDPDSQGPMGEDISMQDQSAAKTSSEGSATRIFEPTVLTRLQQKKRAAKAQPEEPASADDQGAPAPQRVKLKKRSQKNTATQDKANEQGADQQDSSPNPESARDTHASPNPTNHESTGKAKTAGALSEIKGMANGGIENAVAQAQESARAEAKEKDEMWGRIAKAVDVAMAAETPGKIEGYQIKHIVNAILDYALAKPQGKSPANSDSHDQANTTQAVELVNEQGKSATWANIAAQKPPKTPKPPTKPSLAEPLRGMRIDSRLMIRLGENSPHRREHPFLLEKKANATLPPNVGVAKIVHINSGLALIPSPGTKLEQLEENAHRLAQAFGACRVERNEKWAKYLVREVPKRIRTFEGLTDVTTEMAEQAFEMSCGMKPEWGRWIVRTGDSEEEVIEANMIFAVRQQNIRSVPKVISLLGKMRVIVALPPKQTPQQCLQCGEWTHKKENCAKRARCFQCSSDKHFTSMHCCIEEECKDGVEHCPHPPRCIVCSGPHITSYEQCPFRPVYSKLKGSIKRPDGPEVLRIRGQQKPVRNRVIRENRLQNEMAAQMANSNAVTSTDYLSKADNSMNKW